MKIFLSLTFTVPITNILSNRFEVYRRTFHPNVETLTETVGRRLNHSFRIVSHRLILYEFFFLLYIMSHSTDYIHHTGVTQYQLDFISYERCSIYTLVHSRCVVDRFSRFLILYFKENVEK